jgi:hypothetical protein
MAEKIVKIELLVVLFIAIALIAVIGLNKPQTVSDNNLHSSIVITAPTTEVQQNTAAQHVTGQFFPAGTGSAALTVQPSK